MQRVASFDSKALEALYDRYSPLLFTLVKKIVSDEKLAEEVLSEIFAIIWQKIHLFDFKSGDVYTWLILLSRNKATDTLKRQNGGDVFGKYDDEYENNFIIPHLSPVIDVVDIQTALSIKDSFEAALNKLTDAQQYVIYLAFYEGLTQKEIATKLNIPLQTVKSKIIIALKNLRENLIKGDS
jgi:RNA polymerase sigma-70 factor (ECF subfamily)